MSGMSPAQWLELVRSKDAMLDAFRQQIDALKQQLDWFKRQLFGAKSERFAPAPDPTQMHLGEVFPLPAQPVPVEQRLVPAHTRRVASKDLANDGESLPFFDASRVPIETIVLPNPEVEGLAPEQFEVIGEKVSHRLAQRPGSFVVLTRFAGSEPERPQVGPQGADHGWSA